MEAASAMDNGRENESQPETDEQLRNASLDELKTLNRTVEIVDYDPIWPLTFQQEARRLRLALGDRALRIEHVGSTSVPKLAAKPVIDIVLVVADSADEQSYAPALEALGYVLCIREPHWYEHRMLKGSIARINLHCFSQGCVEVERMLLFRNWLRANEIDRQLYEHTKRELAARPWNYLQDYANAKGSVVTEIMDRAQRNTSSRV